MGMGKCFIQILITVLLVITLLFLYIISWYFLYPEEFDGRYFIEGQRVFLFINNIIKVALHLP